MEIWKTVPGYEGYYEASSEGRIKSVSRVVYRKPSINLPRGGTFPVRERILKPAVIDRGYLRVTLWKAHVKREASVHVLVAEAFHGPRPDGYHACHKNGISSDCREENIYWGTPTQNSADKLSHGTHIQGEGIPWAKLSEEDVLNIRKLYGSFNQFELADLFGVQQSQISRVVNRKEWAHI